MDDPLDPGWVAVDHYRLLSLPIVVRVVDEEISAAIRWHLAPFARPRSQTEGLTVDVIHAEEVADPPRFRYIRGANTHAASAMGVLHFALWDIQSLPGKVSRDFLFLHAGSVAGEGGALLLPAASNQGKSTLVAALLQAGFDYLSDELGAVDPVTGRVYPFEKRITLPEESLRFFPGLEDRLQGRSGLSDRLVQRYVRPEDLGAAVHGPAPVRWLVFLSADREGPPKLTPLGKAEAVRRMASHSFNLYRYSERGVILLSRVAAGSEAFRLDGGSPLERAALLKERFA